MENMLPGLVGQRGSNLDKVWSILGKAIGKVICTSESCVFNGLFDGSIFFFCVFYTLSRGEQRTRLFKLAV